MGNKGKRFEFGPGEEKLADLTEIVVGLQKAVMLLGQRSEIDAILISTLLDELPDPAATLERWQTKTGPYYTDQAVSHLASEETAHQNEELKRRLDLWTRALRARVGAQD